MTTYTVVAGDGHIEGNKFFSDKNKAEKWMEWCIGSMPSLVENDYRIVKFESDVVIKNGEFPYEKLLYVE